ncbi:glycerate kinase [Nocardioides sp. zg-1228]|uniref:glycerate kinase family protein n=1 Tax=Nocardioides sp. zg-1228 TaxID=2763008 RepID=UPI0016424865|nr:glycerate kinase [Nocardioides sp. zg-1228]MBC2933445.1 glycerate kinase [Nocardioides sp. zg-1228]QSF56408.1 glycerate kinase [Nocardioides sp. zg-1228]
MRVLIAPDKFAGTLTAVQAAEAVAAGWRRQAPGDDLDLAPMADGGPGFVDVLHAAMGGELAAVTVSGPHGAPVPAAVLRVGTTAYVEAAQAAGLHLVSGPVETASSVGVGELVLAAVEGGARTVVVGLGGTGTNDGGAGVLATLGAVSDGPLDGGAAPLGSVTTVDLAPARRRLDGVTLVAASDVDNPLTGLFGATKTFGPQKGVAEDRIAEVDGWLEAFAVATDRRTSLDKGAGAAGGIGYALLALGATRQPGIGLVAEAVSLADRARAADLVVTGEGAFDFSSRAGKVPYGVAEIASEALRPCIALAGQVLVGSREMRALGIESAYSLVDLVGEERAFSAPAEALADLAARVARTWSR